MVWLVTTDACIPDILKVVATFFVAFMLQCQHGFLWAVPWSGCLTLLGTRQKFHVGLLTTITTTYNPAADPYPYEGEAAVRCCGEFCHEPPGRQG